MRGLAEGGVSDGERAAGEDVLLECRVDEARGVAADSDEVRGLLLRDLLDGCVRPYGIDGSQLEVGHFANCP